MKRKIVIGFRLQGEIGRRLLVGALRVTAGTPDWDVRIVHDAKELEIEVKTADGVLVDSLASPTVIQDLIRTNIPAVLVNTEFTRPPAPRIGLVHTDDGAIGLMAARHLLSLGTFRSFGFIPARGDLFWSQRRGRAFALQLKRAGKDVNEFIRPSDQNDEGRALCAWLKKLPLPTAIFAAWDVCSVELLEACRKVKIEVPRQIAILGVDNAEIFCEQSGRSLSSIDFDPEGAGASATHLLNQILRKKSPVAKRIILAGPKTVIERTSTKPAIPAAHLVERALAFIRANATNGIKPSNVADHLGVSRSLLYLRFKMLEHTTLAQAITSSRLEILASKIRSSQRHLDDLTHSCGFSNVNATKNLFHRTYGMSMREWRKLNNQTDSDYSPTKVRLITMNAQAGGG